MSTYTRAHLVRDSLVFQGKLLLDGFRDLALFPVAIVATLLDLVSKAEPPARNFRSVLKLGQRTERWISLFSAAERLPGVLESAEGDRLDEMLNVDGMVDQIERLIVQEYERDGETGSARETVDRTWRRIDRRRRALQRLRNRNGDPAPGE
jgi:hypothetical protein